MDRTDIDRVQTYTLTYTDTQSVSLATWDDDNMMQSCSGSRHNAAADSEVLDICL